MVTEVIISRLDGVRQTGPGRRLATRPEHAMKAEAALPDREGA